MEQRVFLTRSEHCTLTWLSEATRQAQPRFLENHRGIMANKKSNGNRKGRNASDGGNASNGKHTKQGKSVPASRDDLNIGAKKGGYDHARPVNNKASKRHNTRGVTAGKAAGKQNAKAKNVPNGKVPRNQDGKMMVPWVEAPAAAQVHHYYFVIREMLEGAMPFDKSSEANRFGIQQLDLHGGDAGSVESLLTQSPRLRRDWRAVVGILRMLHEDDYIPASFVEKVLRNHPLTGARSVRTSEDVMVKKDYVQDRIRKSNKKWVEEAKASYTRAINKMRKEHESEFTEEQMKLIPGITPEQCAVGAQNAWDTMSAARKMPTIEVDGTEYRCESEDAFVVAHMTRRAKRDAARLPTLYTLKGGVSYEVMGKDGLEKKSDYINIEYAVKPNGKVFLAVVHGGNKRNNANSPFRAQHCRMQSHKDTFLHIDDFCTPAGVNEGFIQREREMTPPSITDDMTVGEILTTMSDNGWHVSDDRFNTERKKREKKQMRRVQPVRKRQQSRKG